MERRGVYRKGSAGHPRNVNSYQITRQKFKKWRFPLTALLAFALIFGTVPGTGEVFQTSLLTASEREALVTVAPEQARKTILNELRYFVDDCKKYKITECSEKGELVINDVVNSGDDVLATLDGVEHFVAEFEGVVAQAVCKYELSAKVENAKALQKSVSDFTSRYGESFTNSQLTVGAADLNKAVSGLSAFVDSCFK